MNFRGGENSTGEMRNFHPALTILLSASYRGTCVRRNLGLWVQPRDGFLPESLSKVGIEARDFQIHVSDPPYYKVSRNSLRLQF